mgnify:CR=1 FL=1
MKVLIGTNNKGKVEGAKQAFEKFYENVEVVGISVDSGVSDEPMNDEIYQGVSNRVNNLIKYAEDNNVEADFFIGVESGITNKFGKWCIIQIAVIKDKNGYESFGTGPAFPVPDKYCLPGTMQNFLWEYGFYPVEHTELQFQQVLQ